MFVTLAILLLILILFVLLSFKKDTSRRLAQLEQELEALRKKLSSSEQAVKTPDTVFEKRVSTTEDFQKEKPVAPVQPVLPKPEGTPRKEEIRPTISPVESKPIAQPVPPVSFTTEAPVKPRKPTFFERNPDLEKFVGENLASKIGIAILVLAIGYFVKYAIDNEWIGTIGRVAVGIVCGGILVGIAHWLRNRYHAFSSVLAGGGLAVFYFTITLAFQQYHLFSQPVAFVIMLLITAFAVLLSLLYNRQELAVIALTGGFAAPLLLNTGSGNYITLFIYLIVLNVGLLLIAYNKAWRILNATAFAFTVILFASWLYSLPDATGAIVYRNAFVFATIFYLLFLVINIANNIKENKQFLAFDFSILLLNTGLFFGAGLYCLHNRQADGYNGLFSAVMGVFNLVLSYFLFRKRSIDTNILYLLIGITLSFVSLTAPLQLHGHFITLFWASEAVLLCWLFIKSKISIIQFASLIVYACAIISLVGDWINTYYQISTVNSIDPVIPIVFNRGVITSVYLAVASFLISLLLRKNNSQLFFVKPYWFLVSAFVVLLIAGNLEIRYQFSHRYLADGMGLLYRELYSFLLILLILFFSKKESHLYVSQKWQTTFLISSILIYFFLLPQTINLLSRSIGQRLSSFPVLFFAHWIVAILVAIFIYRLSKEIIGRTDSQKEKLTWLISLAIVMFLSFEVYLLTLQLFYTSAEQVTIDRVFVKTVLPVLWGLCSFGFMWLGMKYKYKTLRIVSLSLFSFTLLKLFVYDISNIPVAGKIVAFFCLGVLLLIISFMYQRLKEIIIEDEAKPRL